MYEGDTPNVSTVTDPTAARGVLRPAAALEHFTLERVAPAASVAPYVEHHWVVAWSLPPGHVHEQKVLPAPSVNMTFQPWGVRVSGVMRGQFSTELQGTERVLGVRFRPGGFRPFLGAPLTSITDRQLAIGDVFGADGDRLWAEVRDVAESDGDPAGMATRVDHFLAERAPETPPAEVDLVSRIVATIADEPSITRAHHVADRFGLGDRTLQRLFAEWVGVGVKWVIQRYRIYEAVDLAAAGGPVTWSRVAADLGFTDQAHFTRAFTAMVGISPAAYARECATAVTR